LSGGIAMSENHQIYHSSTFQRFLSRKKVFIFGLTLFFFSYYLLLPVLTSYFPTLMTYKVYGDLTFAWIFAFSQFIMTGTISCIYYKKAKSYDITVEQIRREHLNRGKEA
jgi:uncharacterized membrane protein (DUF485 family)